MFGIDGEKYQNCFRYGRSQRDRVSRRELSSAAAFHIDSSADRTAEARAADDEAASTASRPPPPPSSSFTLEQDLEKARLGLHRRVRISL